MTEPYFRVLIEDEATGEKMTEVRRVPLHLVISIWEDMGLPVPSHLLPVEGQATLLSEQHEPDHS